MMLSRVNSLAVTIFFGCSLLDSQPRMPVTVGLRPANESRRLTTSSRAMASAAATDQAIYFAGERVVLQLSLTNPTNSSLEIRWPFSERSRLSMLELEEVNNLESRWKRLTIEPDFAAPAAGNPTIDDKVLEESIWLHPGQVIREKIDVQASCEQLGAACNVPLKPGKYRLLYNSPYSFVSYFEVVEPKVKEIDYLRLDQQHLSLAESGARIFRDRYLMVGCVTFEGSDYIILSMKPGYSRDRPAFKAGTPLNAELVPTYQPYFRVTKGTGPIVGVQASASRNEKVTLRWRDDAGEHIQVLVPPYAAYDTGAN